MAKKRNVWFWGESNNKDSGYSEQEVFDANNVKLTEWDTVVAIKNISWKWVKIKRWDKFKNIRFTSNSQEIESWKLVLKTEFFKKI